MDKPSHSPETSDERRNRLFGDPGVGGLLADPLMPPRPHQQPDPNAGAPSPDPAPPRHHGNWTLPRKDHTRPGPRLAAIMRRKSRSGMPRALFREDDGTDLNDLRTLALAYRHHFALRPLSAGKVTIRRNAI